MVEMPWDPAVLRKYNITGHFRLLNQLRGELQNQPLVRGASPRPGRSSRSGSRTVEVRPQSYARNRRQSFADQPTVAAMPPVEPTSAGLDQAKPSSFRDRLNAIEMC